MIKELWIKWIRMNQWPYRLLHFPRNFCKFIGEVFFFLRNGYPYEATYEHYQYFINVQQKIFKNYLKTHWGYPGYGEAATNEQWEAIIQYMIELLGKMDESNYDYTRGDPFAHEDEMIAAKNEFFELYSKWFYHLWD